jgi:hypothetical protein
MIRDQYEKATEATLRETRRKAYAALLADLNNVFHFATSTNYPDYSEYITLVRDLNRSLAEAKILASDAVRYLADYTVPWVVRYKAERLKKRDESITDDQGTGRYINDLLYSLERLMARDLGVPASTKEEWEKTDKFLKDAYDDLEARRQETVISVEEDADHQG